MGEPKPKAPGLPREAPQELKDFVACKRADVELTLGELGWVPKPPSPVELPAPTVSAEMGSTPNTGTLTIAWGFLSISLPVSVVDGQLQVESGNLGAIPGLGAQIDSWVRSFNDTMRANGKRLSGFRLNGNRLALTKVAALAPPPANAVPGQPATPPPPPPPSQPPPAPAPTPTPTPDETSNKPGCALLGGILVGLVAVIGGVTFFVTRDGDDPQVAPSEATAAEQPPTTAGATTTAPAPTTTAPATTAPATTTTIAATTTTQAPLDVCAALGGQPLGWSTAEIAAGCNWSGPLSCDTGLLVCNPLQTPPLIDVASGIQVRHDGSVPDALTGQVGLSAAGLGAVPYFSAPGVLIIQAQCGGTTTTGQAAFSPATPVLVEFPLFSFGPCQIQTIGVATDDGAAYGFDPTQLPNGGAFTVGPDESRPAPPTVRNVPIHGLPLDDSLVVLGALGDQPFGCIRLQAPGAPVYNLCDPQVPGPPIVFTASDPPLFAGFANPFGALSAAPGEVSGYSTAPLFGDAGLFPCGPGPLAITVCGTGGNDTVDTGSYVVFSRVFPEPIEEGPTHGTWELLIRDDTYSADLDPVGWTLTVSEGPTNARLLVRGNSATLVIPVEEIDDGWDLTYTSRLRDGQGALVSETAGQANGTITLPSILRSDTPADTTTTVTAGAETPEGFLDQLSHSLRTDGAFALSRLNPLVLEAYSADACAAGVRAQVNPTFGISTVSVGETGPWTWVLPDGRSYAVDDALTVTIDQSGNGDTRRVDAHIVLRDGVFTWFTFC